MREKQKLLEKFDSNRDNYMDSSERNAALDYLASEKAEGRGPGRPGRGGFGPGNHEPTSAGVKLSVGDVKQYPEASLYAPQVLRTFFLRFESADWEKELADFKNTDVEVPATLTVDGKVYKDVGVHFRGASSFMMVGEGRKRSLNIALDYKNKDQALGGYHTLNLLNSHDDPTFLRTLLSYEIARDYIPAPKANLARVVINGESWGIYANAQQFNKDFVKEWFGTKRRPLEGPGQPAWPGQLKLSRR